MRPSNLRLAAAARAAFQSAPLLRPHAAFAFESLEELDDGPDSRIQSVRDRRFQRPATLTTPKRQGPEDQERFLRAAARLAGLDHPAIPTLYECGRSPSGELYMLTKLVRGDSLADRLKAHARRGLPTRARPAFIRALIRVCEALEYAHERGVIHGRVRAEHIRLGRHGEVILQGWEDSRAEAGAMEAGAMEDIAAIGAILHALLTGEAPGAKGSPPLPSTELGDLTGACLARELAGGPGSARELGRRLRAILERGQEPRVKPAIAWLTLGLAAALVLALSLVRAWSEGRHRAALDRRRGAEAKLEIQGDRARERLKELAESGEEAPRVAASSARVLAAARGREAAAGAEGALAVLDAARARLGHEALTYRAELLVRLGRLEEAIAAFDAALDAGAPKAPIYERRAQLCMSSRRFARQALADLRALVAIRPEDAKVHNQLSAVALSCGEYPLAIVHARRALELDPEVDFSRLNLITAYSSNKDFDLAFEHIAVLLKRDPEDLQAIYARGRTLEAMGRKDEAIADLRKVRDQAPKGPLKRAAQGRLRGLEGGG